MHCFFIHQAEVQPDLAKQCQCQPNAERRELALKSYAEVQPDFAKQRYNLKTPNSKFFCRLISQPPSFSHLKICPQPLFTGAYAAFSHRAKK